MFTKEIEGKLYAAYTSENEQDPKVIVKIHNVLGPGVFYALEGHRDEDTGEFLAYGLTNIDFSKGEITYDPEYAMIDESDLETFNIPFGRVKFEIDTKFSGHISDAIAELSTLNN